MSAQTSGRAGQPEITGARIRLRRRLAWAETDAAGHNHFSVAVRWLEEAEHELWRSLGFAEIVPDVPRVHLELDYAHRIWFNQEVEVTLGVVRVGTSSLHLAYTVHTLDGIVAQSGRYVIVHAPDAAGSTPWPDRVRAALLAAP